jgi:DNA repair photolyase
MPIPANLDPKTDFLGRGVRDGTESDPFPWMDHKYQITLNFLRQKPNKSSLEVETRSNLIAHDDYLDELKRLDVVVTMLFGDADMNTCRHSEPGAPSNKRRAQAVDKLIKNGIQVVCIYLDENGKERDKQLVDHYKFEDDNTDTDGMPF